MSDPQGPVVLIVEDEVMIRISIVDEFRSCGWQVLEADKGEEALETILANRVDLLFTDIRLAGTLTGWDVADALRKQRPDTPVIYVSGNGRDQSRQVTGSLFFSKPYDANAVIAASQTLVKPND